MAWNALKVRNTMESAEEKTFAPDWQGTRF